MFPNGTPRALSLTRRLWLHKAPRQQGKRHASTSSSSGSSSAVIPGGWGSLLNSAFACGGFSLISDTLVQSIELQSSKKERGEHKDSSDAKKYEPDRAARMLGFGLLFYGPLQHFWYALLDKQFNRKTYLPHFASKVVLNQIVLGPIVVMSVFAWNLALQNKLDQLNDKVKRDYVPSIINGWKFWVPAASVNFWLVPLKRQVVFMSACSIVWTGYLSYASNLNQPKIAASKRK